MSVVKPFRGLRPTKKLAEKVASPPYDVLDSNEAREMARGNPLTFLQVNKPEIDLDPACTGVQIEWLFKCAVIDSIVDVPGDQGGWARIHIARSAYDTDGMTMYNVWP